MTRPDIPEARLQSERAIPNRVTVAYLTALALIALLACMTYLILDAAISDQIEATRIVTIVDRQSLLSQRIGLLAMDLAAGNVTVRGRFFATVAEMERNEDALTKGGNLRHTTPLSPAARRIFLGGPAPLDASVREFIETARQFADPAAPGSRAAYQRLEYVDPRKLLPLLESAASLLEKEADARAEHLRATEEAVLVLLLGALMLEALFIFRPLVRKTKSYAADLHQLATRDSLTGLANRRSFMEAAEQHFSAAKRGGEPLSALIVDIDHFKRLNDVHGHAVGDSVLRRFAGIAAATLRHSDRIGRTGGEEFAILLPETELQGAMVVAEKLRLAVAEERSNGLPRITISVGIGVLAPGDRAIDDLLRRADQALYRAKSAGRNRVATQAERPSGALAAADAS